MSEVRVGRIRRDCGVSVARPSVLGNPYEIGKDGDRDVVIDKHRRYFESALVDSPAVIAAVDHLVQLAREGDLTLLCWCAPKACHADIIAEEIRRRVAADG